MNTKHAPAYALINGQMKPCIILQWKPVSGGSPTDPAYASILYRMEAFDLLDNAVVSMQVCRTRSQFCEGLDDFISGHTPESFTRFVERHYSGSQPPIELLVNRGAAYAA